MPSRPAVLIYFLAGVLTLAQQPPEMAVIEGNVVSLGGAPLSKASVRLFRQAATPILITTTDTSGKFVLDDVEPGTYTLTAQRAGYVNQTYGAHSPAANGTPLVLLAGTHLKDLVVTMTPQGLVSGRITDDDGDPVSNVRVTVYKSSYVAGHRQLNPVGFGTVNPDSTFMAGQLAPGRYYVAAENVQPMNDAVIRNTPATTLLRTYYPFTQDASAAIPVEITAGADIRGIDISLQKGKVYRVRGTAAGLQSASGIRLMIVNANAAAYEPAGTAEVQRDGTFVFSNVPTGTYIIFPVNAPQLISFASVNVADQDADGVALEFGPGIAVAGVVRMEPPPAQPLAPLPVNIAPLSDIPYGRGGARSNENGAFQSSGLLPMRYRIDISRLPPGVYVKSIRAGGQEIAPDNLDLSGGAPSSLEVVLSPEAAELTGVVRNDKGDTVSDATVALWRPVDPTKSYNPPPQQASTDQNGNFTIGNLPPGEYLLAAWEDLEPGVALNPDFLARFEASAAKVILTTTGRMAMNVTSVDSVTAANEVARLP